MEKGTQGSQTRRAAAGAAPARRERDCETLFVIHCSITKYPTT